MFPPAFTRRLGIGMVVWLPCTGIASAAESHYLNLLEQGVVAEQSGDAAGAIKLLEIACFGLLDEPTSLARCLTHLAAAQGAADARQDFADTVTRLLLIEQRFQAYSTSTDIDPSARSRFEDRLVAWMPYDTLRAVPAFGAAARRKQIADLAGLEPGPRREALAALVAQEPQAADWRLMLAQLELAQGSPAAAKQALEPLLGQPTPPPGARCSNGRANAALGKCAEALADLARCTDGSADETATLHHLTCLIRSAHLDEAQSMLAALPSSTRARRPFRRLSRDLRQARKAASATATATDATAATDADTIEPTEDAADTSAGGGSSSDTGTITVQHDAVTTPPAIVEPRDDGADARNVLRARLGTAADETQVATVLADATTLAEARPDDRDAQRLVIEIAYRLRRWPDVVTYARRASLSAEHPAHQFYLAIALYESGEREAAAETLRQCLSKINQTDFVKAWANQILGEGDP